MNRAIWKFKLTTDGVQQVSMPEGSVILCVQTQGGCPCIWATVNPDAQQVKRTFEIFGTGHPMPEATRTYIGTYQMLAGSLVFHLFELLSLKSNPNTP